MQRKEGLPSARGQREKGDRLCHVITPRDKAGALKEINKKASASYERREFFYKKTRRYKTGDEKKSGSRKKKETTPGEQTRKREEEKGKKGGIDVLFNRIFHQLSASFSSF